MLYMIDKTLKVKMQKYTKLQLKQQNQHGQLFSVSGGVVSNKTTMASDAENYTKSEACLKITLYTEVAPKEISLNDFNI